MHNKHIKSFMRGCKTKHISRYTMIQLKDGSKFIMSNKHIDLSSIILNGDQYKEMQLSNIHTVYRVWIAGNDDLYTHHTMYITQCKRTNEYYGFPIFSDTGLHGFNHVTQNQESYRDGHLATFITDPKLPITRWVRFIRLNQRTKQNRTGIMELSQPNGFDDWNPVGYVNDSKMEMIKIQLHINKNDICYQESTDENNNRFQEWNLSQESFQYVLNHMLD